MCISAPGRVVGVEGDIATVDYEGERREAGTQLVDVSVGDWVLVNARMVIEKLDPDVAKKSLKMWKEAIDGKP